MRIAFITFEYPPSIEGGAGIYAANLTKELVNIGHEVHVLTPYFPGTIREETFGGVFIHRVDIINKPYILALSFWINVRKALKILEQRLGGFDILHGNNLTNLLIFQKTMPQIVTVHSLASLSISAERPGIVKRLFDRGENNCFFRSLERSILNRSDIIIANSLFTKNALCTDNKFSIEESKVFVIPNGASIETIDPLQKDEEFELRRKFCLGNYPVILFVGRLVPRKGLHFLIQAIKKLNDGDIRAKLVVVGDGSDKQVYINLVNKLNLTDQVIFTGYINDKLLKGMYSLCQTVAIPSINEPFGIVILDAMAAGKPIVAFDSGAVPEILEDNVNGMLVRPEDPISFAEALSKYLSDPELAKKTGRSNLELVVSKYSWKKYAEELDQVYNFTIMNKEEKIDGRIHYS